MASIWLTSHTQNLPSPIPAGAGLHDAELLTEYGVLICQAAQNGPGQAISVQHLLERRSAAVLNGGAGNFQQHAAAVWGIDRLDLPFIDILLLLCARNHRNEADISAQF